MQTTAIELEFKVVNVCPYTIYGYLCATVERPPA